MPVTADSGETHCQFEKAVIRATVFACEGQAAPSCGVLDNPLTLTVPHGFHLARRIMAVLRNAVGGINKIRPAVAAVPCVVILKS